jgi:hypothetical protein
MVHKHLVNAFSTRVAGINAPADSGQPLLAFAGPSL